MAGQTYHNDLLGELAGQANISLVSLILRPAVWSVKALQRFIGDPLQVFLADPAVGPTYSGFEYLEQVQAFPMVARVDEGCASCSLRLAAPKP